MQKRRRVNKRTRADWQRFLGLGKRRNRASKRSGDERSGSSAGRGVGDPRALTIYGARTRKFSQYATSGAFVRACCIVSRECIMCEKRGMCTGKRQVPLLVVTTLLVGVRPELVGEYKLIYRDKKGCRCKYLNGANGSL